MSPDRLAEIQNLNVDSCSADAPHNPDVWALEAARTDLLAEVERLRARLSRAEGVMRRALGEVEHEEVVYLLRRYLDSPEAVR